MKTEKIFKPYGKLRPDKIMYGPTFSTKKNREKYGVETFSKEVKKSGLQWDGDNDKAFAAGKKLARSVAKTSVPSMLKSYSDKAKAKEEAFAWVLEEAGIQSVGFVGIVTEELGRNFDSGLKKGFTEVWKEKVSKGLK